jgi:hypothetical protein
MVTLKTVVKMKGVTSKEAYDFMLNLNDADYQRWWKGTHLICHTVKKYPGDEGNLVYIDEYVGRHRLKGYAVITKLVLNKEIIYQFKAGVKIPAWLIIRIEDLEDGIRLTHIVEAGGCGIWKIFDPFFRLYLNKSFESDLTAHAHQEFPMLAEMLIKDRH